MLSQKKRTMNIVYYVEYFNYPVSVKYYCTDVVQLSNKIEAEI